MIIENKSNIELSQIPLIGRTTKKILEDHGIKNIKQLSALSGDNYLSTIIPPLRIIVNYAKAIYHNKIIVREGIISAFDTIENKNIYFFDAEYDSRYTETGPYGVFILGLLDTEGNPLQFFLENPDEELQILQSFSDWVEKNNPVLITYGSNCGDALELAKCFSRYNLSFTHIKKSFFDLYANVVFTQNVNKQKYYLPIVKSSYKPLGLKRVSECLGYRPSDLKISNGIAATFEYEKYIQEEHKKIRDIIKMRLLKYNRDDLKRTKFIYDILKQKIP